jgi:hypothetical protein
MCNLLALLERLGDLQQVLQLLLIQRQNTLNQLQSSALSLDGLLKTVESFQNRLGKLVSESSPTAKMETTSPMNGRKMTIVTQNGPLTTALAARVSFLEQLLVNTSTGSSQAVAKLARTGRKLEAR